MSRSTGSARRPAEGSQRTELAALLAPVVETFGADLEEITVSRAGSRSVVRVVIDADGGLDLDAVADVSRAVSDTLDGPEAEQLLRGTFVLEVSTPGVDRPLTEPRHWRRAVDRLVSVTRRGAGPLVGRVRSAGEDAAVLAGDDLPGGEVEVAYADVTRAVVQVEFNRPGTAEADDFEDELEDTGESGEQAS